MPRFRVAVAVAALVLTSVGFIAGRATAPTGSPEVNSSTTTTADADLSAEDVQLRTSLRPFIGQWTRHGEAVHIDSDGSGTAVWRIYTVCGESKPPCDTFDGDYIISGGAAFFILIRADESTADGYVLTSSDPATVPVGRIHLELRPDNHLMFPGLGGPLCGPPVMADCGA
ncbi:MAG: hypothetical protein ACOYXM_00950 [Actinomycetota bacterium]